MLGGPQSPEGPTVRVLLYGNGLYSRSCQPGSIRQSLPHQLGATTLPCPLSPQSLSLQGYPLLSSRLGKAPKARQPGWVIGGGGIPQHSEIRKPQMELTVQCPQSQKAKETTCCPWKGASVQQPLSIKHCSLWKTRDPGRRQPLKTQRAFLPMPGNTGMVCLQAPVGVQDTMK